MADVFLLKPHYGLEEISKFLGNQLLSDVTPWLICQLFFLARMFDFIDSGIMEGLQHKLVCMTQARTLGRVGVAGQMVQLRSEIVARRTDLKGNKQLLVRWHPNDV